MLTVYGRSKVARSPKVRKMVGEASVSAQEDAVEEALGALAESLPHRHRSQVETLLLDPANGMAWLDGVVEVARDGPLTVVLSGAFERPPESERTPQHDALDVIKAYRKCDWEHPQFGGGSGVLSTGAEPTAAPAALLGGMHGRFAFVLYDSSENRTVAARDRNGNEQLFWGSPTMGDGLLFASSRDLLEEQAADVDVFPAGTFFVSDKDGSGSGTLLDFDRADLCTGARDAGAEAREAAADDNQEQSRDGGADDRGGEQAAQRAVEECRTASHGNLEDLATAMKRSASIQDLAAA